VAPLADFEGFVEGLMQTWTMMRYSREKRDIVLRLPKSLRVFGAGLLLGAVAFLLGIYSVPSNAQTASQKPNVIFILTDDQRYDDLGFMPKTKQLLADNGMSFDNAYVTFSECCPSRSSILTGEYAHNHQVWGNGSPEGGWQKFRDQGHEQDDLATRLHDAGYKTALMGKYLNNYDSLLVPPGWDDWFACICSTFTYYDYYMNDNGTRRYFGTQAPKRGGKRGHKRVSNYSTDNYSTDVLARRATNFIDANAPSAQPFFVYVAVAAPHGPSTPAPRHEGTFSGYKAPRPPSYNEADVSDKPPWIRNLPLMDDQTQRAIDQRYQDRLESLQAVDDLVEGVVNHLSATGEVDNTYIVFFSDNGLEQGEHRITDGKRRPYEESIKEPLIVRGPGITPGSTTDKIGLNTDFMPTFLDWAGASSPSYVDGRSLRPVLEGTATSWRTAFLLETFYGSDSDHNSFGIRTDEPRKYVEYQGGFRELYNLDSDPYELENAYSGTSPPDLNARLDTLKACAGESCRTAEDGATP
jgi:arylsulfatase A-like enzyme